MAYFITGSGLITEYGRLTASTPVQLMLRDSAVLIASVRCTETLGVGTTALTIDVYDADSGVAYKRLNALTLTAKQTYTDDEPFVVQNGDYLRLTSSALTGGIDYFVSYFNPDATRQQT